MMRAEALYQKGKLQQEKRRLLKNYKLLAALTLEERERVECMFQPKITKYKLRKLYREHMVKKKCISLTKIPNRNTLEQQTIQAAELAQETQRAVDRGFRVVQLDECYVTKNTKPTHVWTMQR